MNTRNIYLYWTGNENTLISILRNLIYLHSTNGKGYHVHLITDKNINDYIQYIPAYFHNLSPIHQSEFVRVNVICDYGGIWLDSETLVINTLDPLFELIENKDGFFIRENNDRIINGIFGSKRLTPLMIEWKRRMVEYLELKQNSIIELNEIGNLILQYFSDSNIELYDNYEIFNGLDNLFPVNWDCCVSEYIDKPFDNYKNIMRNFQPLILVNNLYKTLESKTEKEILDGNMPLNFFINKSFENMKLVDYDFIEIGTSNFETLIELADDTTKGISVDAVKYYIDCLPDKMNCKKINVGISNVKSVLDVYYIDEKVIESNNLPYWFKGCNCINTYHPLHLKHNVSHLCKIEKVNVITACELFYTNNVKKVKYLKIDTEGHDCIILKSLFSYIKGLPDMFYPCKIQFETNEHHTVESVNEIITLFGSIGYRLVHRGYDTIIIYDNCN